MTPTLIIDADDTLWESEIYYQRCIAEFGELMAAQGFDEEEAKETLDRVERERVADAGYGPKAFAENVLIAYETLCERKGLSPDEQVREAARRIGHQVLSHPIILLQGVAETLPRLSEAFELILLTKGNEAIQIDKLTRSGLESHFRSVHVVHEKDAAVFQALIDEYDLAGDEVWMIGNSPRSDINPALAVGLRAVHIPHTHTWGHEQEPIVTPEDVTVLDTFADLAMLFLESERESEEEGDDD